MKPGRIAAWAIAAVAGPDGAPFRIHGDRTLLAGGDGALHAARASGCPGFLHLISTAATRRLHPVRLG